jgi:hypothetical protein
MGGALKSVFNPDIGGTGQSASDLKGAGYSDQELAQLDPKRAMLAGIAKGAGAGFARPQQPMGGGMIAQPGPGPTAVDPNYFAPSNFGQRSPLYG